MNNSEQTLEIFPDTNVLIQGRALHELPWSELGRSGIEIVICGPVIRELDRLKNKGGRAAKVARTMSTKVRELMELPNQSDVIRASEPHVVRRLLLGSAIHKPARDGLDLNHDDQAIINQALTRLDQGGDVVLLTDDNFAAMTAAEFGLPVLMLPPNWLKPPETDDSEKEIARRDAEIARLKSAEPSPVLNFADENGAPLERLEVTMPRYLPIENTDVDRLVERMVRAAPLVDVRSTPAPKSQRAPDILASELAKIVSFNLPVTPVTDAEMEKYSVDYQGWLTGVRKKISEFHVEWNRSRDWPRAMLMAANKGSRPADAVLIEIEASGRFGLSGCERLESAGRSAPEWLSLATPPVPPRPRNAIEELHRQVISAIAPMTAPISNAAIMDLRLPDFPRYAEEFFWQEGERKPARTMKITRKTWRHGRQEEGILFRFWAADTEDLSGLVVGRLSAANLAQAAEVRLPVRVAFEDRSVLPMAEQMVAEFERRHGKR